MLTEILPHDFRSALRHLIRAPGFALVAILLLGTGIGAVTLVYSVINSILIRPLPYAEADQLVGFQAVNGARSIVLPAISISDFRDLRDRQRSLVAMGAYRGDFTTWQRPGEQPLQIVAALVTEDFFRVLGVTPTLGRTFSVEEFSSGAPRTVVLSHQAWVERFKRDPSIVGRIITLGGQPTTVIAVMPSALREPAFVDVWLPFPRESGENFTRDSRHWIALGRMAPGASLSQVQAQTSAITTDLAREFPETNDHWAMTVRPLHDLRVGGVRASLWVLFGATGLLLFVACLNLANLLLARGFSRDGEMAVRQAVGATRQRLLNQLFCESFIVAILGGLIGVASAYAMVAFIAKSVPPELVLRAHEINLDPGVMVFALVVSMVAGVVAGVIPALQSARSKVGNVLKRNSASPGTARQTRRVQHGLLVGQIAGAVVVLTGATLLWKTLAALNHADPGIQTEGVFVMQAAPNTAQYESNEELAHYYERLVRAAESAPGVEAAAVDASAPFSGISLSFPYEVVGAESGSSSSEAVYHFVSPEFFALTELPVTSGRALDRRDDDGRSAVVVVNQTMARLISPDGQAIGRRIRIVPWLRQGQVEVVGIVRDARQANLVDPAPPQLYLSQRQIPWFFSTLMVRVQAGRELPLTTLREVLQKEDPSLPVQFTSLTEQVALTTTQPRLLSLLFIVLGTVTLGFTLFGIYACISLTVTQRTREFGLRLALGATPRNVMGEMLREIVQVVAVGSAIGLAGTWALGGIFRGQLYGLGSPDAQSLVVTCLLVAVASLAAALIPVARAARVLPAVALRHI